MNKYITTPEISKKVCSICNKTTYCKVYYWQGVYPRNYCAECIDKVKSVRFVAGEYAIAAGLTKNTF